MKASELKKTIDEIELKNHGVATIFGHITVFEYKIIVTTSIYADKAIYQEKSEYTCQVIYEGTEQQWMTHKQTMLSCDNDNAQKTSGYFDSRLQHMAERMTQAYIDLMEE